MKTLILVVICIILTGTLITGCDSDRKQVMNAEQKVKEAKNDLAAILQEQRDEAHKLQMKKEWEAYKKECEIVILSNDNQIAELENNIITDEKVNNDDYIARIEELKIENELLKQSIRNYAIESDVSAWEAFKIEVNNDMKSLAEAFKDLSINNTN